MPEAALSKWRTDPYRPLFLLGAAMAWAGVFHWLLLGLGVIGEYRSIFHAMTQIQAFMSCFAAGFLFTFVPRRTGTKPVAHWQLAVAMAAPPLVSLSAWFERWVAAQLCWLALAAVAFGFTVRRLWSAGGLKLGPSFVWVPLAFAIGTAGSTIAAVGAARGDEQMWLHEVGRGMVLQGMFTGFVVGVGSTLLPGLLHGQFPAPPARRRLEVGFHLTACLAFISGFWLEELVAPELGFAVRAAVPAALFVRAGLWRPPSQPGLHRVLVWLGAWLLPTAYAVVAVVPTYKRAGLHLLFIGCFALMALSVSTHVMLSHSGRPEPLSKKPWQLWAIAGLMAAALAQRVLVDLDPVRMKGWIGGASGCFLAATVLWAILVVPDRRAS
ncbi:MAG: NnrS family protein [Myxococcales bacterium]|nr:NnrS family protein [Myxococcales bacterium]